MQYQHCPVKGYTFHPAQPGFSSHFLLIQFTSDMRSPPFLLAFRLTFPSPSHFSLLNHLTVIPNHLPASDSASAALWCPTEASSRISPTLLQHPATKMSRALSGICPNSLFAGSSSQVSETTGRMNLLCLFVMFLIEATGFASVNQLHFLQRVLRSSLLLQAVMSQLALYLWRRSV